MFLPFTPRSRSLLLAIFFLAWPPCIPSRTVPQFPTGPPTELTIKNQTAGVVFGLPITAAPRCGVSDTLHGVHATRRYVFFPGKPRWTRRMPMVLTYAFFKDNWICNLSLNDVKHVFRKAFSKWASAIPVSFEETDDYGFADIKIGFYRGDHSDGQPFDGVLGVLAHSFSPEIGRLHLDAAETWAIDFESEKSTVAVDLESVATHEIGHLLGLGHSWVKESVMYPSLKPREKKANLEVDDVQGVQALYGSNPNFKLETLELESDTSASQAAACRSRTWVVIAIWLFFFSWHYIVLLLPRDV